MRQQRGSCLSSAPQVYYVVTWKRCSQLCKERKAVRACVLRRAVLAARAVLLVTAQAASRTALCLRPAREPLLHASASATPFGPPIRPAIPTLGMP